MYKALIILSSVFCVSCEFFGKEQSEEWFDENVEILSIISSDIRETHGLSHVSGRSRWKNNIFNSFDHDPSKLEIEKYNEISDKLSTIGLISASINRNAGSFEFVTYDSGVFGDIYESYDYIPDRINSVKLSTPEIWKCSELKVLKWFKCVGVNSASGA